MRIGFIHGVLNTDNVAISGESIDYGPCAFMDSYDPKTKFSSIDHQGRYAYGNQANIAKWNMARFAETLIPMIDVNTDKAVEILETEIETFSKIYHQKSLAMMRGKLGIEGDNEEDNLLIEELLLWMNNNQADYTNTFRALMNKKFNTQYQNKEFEVWYKIFEARKPNVLKMRQFNPVFIPRNHKVEESLEAAHTNNLEPLQTLLKVLEDPYKEDEQHASYLEPDPKKDKTYKTFCGT